MIRDNWVPDATALNAFRECPERFRLRYVLGLKRRARDEALDGGQAWHHAMEAWFDNKGYDQALTCLRAGWPDTLVEGEHEKRPLSLYERLLQLYVEKYPREQDPFEVIHNEQYIEGLIDNVVHPFKYCGIVDRGIQLGDNYVTMDSKTTSAWLNRDYFEAFELSQAQIGYGALELVNGREWNGYYIDAVHIDTRYHKAKETDFVRYGPIKVPTWKIDVWARDTESTLAQLEWFWERFGAEQPWEHREQGCHSWGKWCPFWSAPSNRDFPGLCRSPQELHESLIGEYDVEFWLPSERGS